MLNFKISLVLFVGLLAMAAGGLMVNNYHYGELLEKDMEHDLLVARETVLRSKVLDMNGQMATAKRVVAWPKFAEKLLAAYPEGIEGLDERHQQIWEELNVWSEKLKAARREDASKGAQLEHRRAMVPDEMFVVDASGAAVARLTDYAWWGNNLAKDLPVVIEVGKTHSFARDLWKSPDGGLMEVAVAPILGHRAIPDTDRQEEVFLGSLVLGYRMSEKEAKHLRRLTGVHACFFHSDQITAGTLGVDYLKALTPFLKAAGVFATGRLSASQVQTVNQREFHVTAGLYTGYSTKEGVGFVLLLDRKERLAPVVTMNTYIPLAAVLVFLLLVFLNGAIIRGFVRPFEELDQGIHEFINGNFDHTFPTTERETMVGNMAHSLNLMVCILLGRPIPEDEDTPSAPAGGGPPEGWKDPLFIDAVSQVRKRPNLVALPGGLAPPPGAKRPEEDAETEAPAPPADTAERSSRVEAGSVTRELAIEPEHIYYRRVFEEYLAARKETGEGVKGVTFDKFMAKLKKSEEQIKQQLSCRMVRFRIQKKDGRVSLKPIPME